MLNNILEGFVTKKVTRRKIVSCITKVLSTLVVTFYMIPVTLVFDVTDRVRLWCGPYRVNIATHVMAFSTRVGSGVSK